MKAKHFYEYIQYVVFSGSKRVCFPFQTQWHFTIVRELTLCKNRNSLSFVVTHWPFGADLMELALSHLSWWICFSTLFLESVSCCGLSLASIEGFVLFNRCYWSRAHTHLAWLYFPHRTLLFVRACMCAVLCVCTCQRAHVSTDSFATEGSSVVEGVEICCMLRWRA